MRESYFDVPWSMKFARRLLFSHCLWMNNSKILRRNVTGVSLMLFCDFLYPIFCSHTDSTFLNATVTHGLNDTWVEQNELQHYRCVFLGRQFATFGTRLLLYSHTFMLCNLSLLFVHLAWINSTKISTKRTQIFKNSVNFFTDTPRPKIVCKALALNRSCSPIIGIILSHFTAHQL